ncbi:hypothetical protein [Vibrio bathopelagicus]
MKLAEKIKVEKAIKRVESTLFDENDVETIFMKLRAYSSDFPLFREVADFVAHNDERDKGILKSEFEAVALGVKFINEYKPAKNQLELDKGFPSWVKKHLTYELDKTPVEEVKAKFGCSKKSLEAKIDKAIKVNNKTKIATISLRKTAQSTIDAIVTLLSGVRFQDRITDDLIFKSIIGVLQENQVEVNIDLFTAQKSKVMISILYLIHNTKFSVIDGVVGTSSLGCEDFRPRIAETDAGGKGFGNLSIMCYVPSEIDGKKVTFVTPVITTSLPLAEWVSEGVIYQEGDAYRVRLSDDLLLDGNFKIDNVAA